MSNRLRRCITSSGLGLVIAVISLLACIPMAHAEDDGQNGSNGNKGQTYNPGTRSVTVTANGNRPGSSRGAASSNSHAGMVLMCGTWMTPAQAALSLSCQKTSPGPSVAEIAIQAAASVTLPLNSPQFGPLPSQNQWGMIPVGYPVWLWTSSDQTTVSTSVDSSGLVVSITATRQGVTFAMGDGHNISCTRFTVRPTHLADPMQPSPSCGYVYQTTGIFTIVATTSWLISWSAAGESGSFAVTDTASSPTPLPIGELASVITDHP